VTTAKISGTILQVSEDWYAWFFERAPQELGLSTQIEEITADGTAITVLEGLALESSLESIFAQVNLLEEINGQELNISTEEINATGSAIQNTNGQELTSEIQEVFSSGSALSNITGLELSSAIESITASTEGSVSVAITGISLTSQTGNVSASGTGEMQMVPGRVSYQLPKLNARTRIDGLILQSQASDLLASGTIIINNTAKIMSIEAVLNLKKIQANGVWDIEENDLILLLAA
jgi:hypothetical protein